ncbi:MAG TPA: ClbS/DfsB family four-helix bundle protein, partial [Ardenticatenaceae bacterium]|nr:ClbS/DfsB family four-helix bundle protein [Ardenticatenaceae bacterium]
QRGERPPDHPSQQDVSIINQWIYLTNRDRPLSDVLRDARAVWQQLEDLIQTTPDQDLLEPGRFDWLEGRPLGPQIVDDFVIHFHDEHEPAIRAWLASLSARE